MSFPRIILMGSISIFLLIAGMSIFKDSKKKASKKAIAEQQAIEAVEPIVLIDEEKSTPTIELSVNKPIVSSDAVKDQLPDADNIHRLFATDSSRLPFIETITYTSRVPWLKGRPAWIADYASYYDTTRHFIARSLNKGLDYFTQKVAPGDKFNVLKKDMELQFQLVIDLSRLKMWFYAYDKTNDEKMLLKTYNVGLGRKDNLRASGYLTPVGKYTIGNKVAIYKPGIMGYFQDQKIEMIRIFGTRWMPFGEEVEDCTEPAKGFGLHGAPWSEDTQTKMLVEDTSKISKYDSDGCVRLLQKDIEEIFSIVISRPTVVELVDDFFKSTLPGKPVEILRQGK